MRACVRRWTGGAGRRGMRRACGRLEAGVAGIVMRAPLEFSDSIQGSRMTAPLHVVILAAGEGKRMKSSLPKVLQKIAGQPMLAHVIAAARGLRPAGVHVVHGHGGGQVRDAFVEQEDLQWVERARQLGTGHAVRQAMPDVPDEAQVLVLYGDVPLITTATLQRLLAADGRIAVLVADLEDPTGYGRIVRDPAGRVGAIVEPKDAPEEQRHIRTINTRNLTPAPVAHPGRRPQPPARPRGNKG